MRTASFWQTDFNASISTAYKCKMKMLSSGMVLNMSRTTNENDEQCAVSKFAKNEINSKLYFYHC
jgi:hypothetical protein